MAHTTKNGTNQNSHNFDIDQNMAHGQSIDGASKNKKATNFITTPSNISQVSSKINNDGVTTNLS